MYDFQAICAIGTTRVSFLPCLESASVSLCPRPIILSETESDHCSNKTRTLMRVHFERICSWTDQALRQITCSRRYAHKSDFWSLSHFLTFHMWEFRRGGNCTISEHIINMFTFVAVLVWIIYEYSYVSRDISLARSPLPHLHKPNVQIRLGYFYNCYNKVKLHYSIF